MDAKSQSKVRAAGFTIIRCDDHPKPRIKMKDRTTSNWVTFENHFKSKAARDRRFKELLNNDKIIQD